MLSHFSKFLNAFLEIGNDFILNVEVFSEELRFNTLIILSQHGVISLRPRVSQAATHSSFVEVWTETGIALLHFGLRIRRMRRGDDNCSDLSASRGDYG